jgi:hypothetical protein
MGAHTDTLWDGSRTTSLSVITSHKYIWSMKDVSTEYSVYTLGQGGPQWVGQGPQH